MAKFKPCNEDQLVMLPISLQDQPKILLKVILLAYARGMISSRQIERACQENILFIALSYGYAPDFQQPDFVQGSIDRFMPATRPTAIAPMIFTMPAKKTASAAR